MQSHIHPSPSKSHVLAVVAFPDQPFKRPLNVLGRRVDRPNCQQPEGAFDLPANGFELGRHEGIRNSPTAARFDQALRLDQVVLQVGMTLDGIQESIPKHPPAHLLPVSSPSLR
ncbi:hypothetical protein D7S81_28105 [Ralstonia insidiosa]|nr:hypothetical protein [Ralstonia insidiosa]MBA9940458.1 hypothetical protein [Ralstonia insidiosa]